jgi:hypothetical protein
MLSPPSDLSPTVKYVPEWFPGAGFKREAKEMKATLNNAATAPYEWAKKHMVGLHKQSKVGAMPNLLAFTADRRSADAKPVCYHLLRGWRTPLL